jgi:hypothetical protein
VYSERSCCWIEIAQIDSDKSVYPATPGQIHHMFVTNVCNSWTSKMAETYLIRDLTQTLEKNIDIIYRDLSRSQMLWTFENSFVFKEDRFGQLQLKRLQQRQLHEKSSRSTSASHSTDNDGRIEHKAHRPSIRIA